MKKNLSLLFFFSLIFSLYSETPFRWRESAWDTGTMYEYRVTGEGKKGIDLFVYVKDDHTVSYFADQSEFSKQVFIYFDFAKPLTNIEIEVLEIYKGTKYSDLCISGLLFK